MGCCSINKTDFCGMKSSFGTNDGVVVIQKKSERLPSFYHNHEFKCLWYILNINAYYTQPDMVTSTVLHLMTWPLTRQNSVKDVYNSVEPLSFLEHGFSLFQSDSEIPKI